MSLIKAIFQLNKLHNLIKKKERIEVETSNLKESLLKSDLVSLLRSIINEHPTSTLTTTSPVDITSQSNKPVEVSPAPLFTTDDNANAICNIEMNKTGETENTELTTEAVSELNNTDVICNIDEATESEEIELITEPVSNIEEVPHTAEPVSTTSSTLLTEEVRKKMSVTILSFDEDNQLIWLQSSERMFDFPYAPEDHVGASVGDTCDLIIYQDDTYLFDYQTTQEEKAA